MQHQPPVDQVFRLDIARRPLEQVHLWRLKTKAQGGQDIRLTKESMIRSRMDI